MPSMIDKTCPVCSTAFKARTADVKRGWGKFCSKSCKAKEQEKRTGQYKDYLEGNTPAQKRARKNKSRNRNRSNVFDLSSALDRKIYEMDNPIIVEQWGPEDYDGPFHF